MNSIARENLSPNETLAVLKKCNFYTENSPKTQIKSKGGAYKI